MRPEAQEARDGKEEESIGSPESEAKTKPLSYSQPRPPSQPNQLPQSPEYGRELGKSTKPISSRNVHLQLEAVEHPLLTGLLFRDPARGLQNHQWRSQNVAPSPCTVMDTLKAPISANAILPQFFLFSNIHSKMTGVTEAVELRAL